MNNEFNNFDRSKDVMTTGEWVVTLLLLGIPCVNIIMLFVWAFGNGNENRKNYCITCKRRIRIITKYC